MDGITDATMRDFVGSWGVFSYAVSEFARVSVEPIPAKVFRRDIPEICNDGKTQSGMPVQVQILGSDLDNMAKSAQTAVASGAKSIDINFGCPAPLVNRHDGGASLLRCPPRIREVVRAVRDALPTEVPVSAKLRLGWDNIDSIFENARMAEEGGAAWITIHARTRVQGYKPPVYWPHIGKVREMMSVPVVANGDIWNLEDFYRCREETGCEHFMVGRGALANPILPFQIARCLGLATEIPKTRDWDEVFAGFVEQCDRDGYPRAVALMRLKQWSKIAHLYGEFQAFDAIKQANTIEEFFESMSVFSADRTSILACSPN